MTLSRTKPPRKKQKSEESQFSKSLPKLTHISCFTKGSCRNNQIPVSSRTAEICIVFPDDSSLNHAERLSPKEYGILTNNKAEMLAAIKAIDIILEHYPDIKKIIINSVSQYLINGMTQWMVSWKKNGFKTSDGKPVKNQELWSKLDQRCPLGFVEWVLDHVIKTPTTINQPIHLPVKAHSTINPIVKKQNREESQFSKSLPKVTHISCFTDGCCRNNQGPASSRTAGIGIFFPDDSSLNHAEQLSPKEYGILTNNKAEMLAAIKAIDIILEHYPDIKKIKINSDSQYLINGMTKWMRSWKRNGFKTANGKPVENQELWSKLDQLCPLGFVEWVYVKAHSNIYGNERADELANQFCANL